VSEGSIGGISAADAFAAVYDYLDRERAVWEEMRKAVGRRPTIVDKVEHTIEVLGYIRSGVERIEKRLTG